MKIEKTLINPKYPDYFMLDHIWTYDEIHRYAKAEPDYSCFDETWYRDNPNDNFVDDHLDGWLDYLREQVAYFGLEFHDDTRTVHFYTTSYNPGWEVRHQAEGIAAVFDLIDKSYEHSGPKPYPTRAWGPMLPDCSGDDAVDYQSSIPSMLCDYVIHLLTQHYPETEK